MTKCRGKRQAADGKAAFATCGLKPQASSLKPAVEAAGGKTGWGGPGIKYCVPRTHPELISIVSPELTWPIFTPALLDWCLHGTRYSALVQKKRAKKSQTLSVAEGTR